MRHRKTKITWAASLLLGGSVLYAGVIGGCAEFGTQAALGSIDFCFLFDCVDGAIGGLLKPCDNVGVINTSFDNRDINDGQGENDSFGQTFTDCN